MLHVLRASRRTFHLFFQELAVVRWDLSPFGYLPLPDFLECLRRNVHTKGFVGQNVSPVAAPAGSLGPPRARVIILAARHQHLPDQFQVPSVRSRGECTTTAIAAPATGMTWILPALALPAAVGPVSMFASSSGLGAKSAAPKAIFASRYPGFACLLLCRSRIGHTAAGFTPSAHRIETAATARSSRTRPSERSNRTPCSLVFEDLWFPEVQLSDFCSEEPSPWTSAPSTC